MDSSCWFLQPQTRIRITWGGFQTRLRLGLLEKLRWRSGPWCFPKRSSDANSWWGSPISGRLRHLAFLGPLFGGAGGFSCGFISCGEELGLWLFGRLSWVFFPQGSTSLLLHLFFDSWLLPPAFLWGFGLWCFWGLQSWGGLSLLPMRGVGTRTLLWRLLSCGMFLYLSKRRQLSLGKKESH